MFTTSTAVTASTPLLPPPPDGRGSVASFPTPDPITPGRVVTTPNYRRLCLENTLADQSPLSAPSSHLRYLPPLLVRGGGCRSRNSNLQTGSSRAGVRHAITGFACFWPVPVDACGTSWTTRIPWPVRPARVLARVQARYQPPRLCGWNPRKVRRVPRIWRSLEHTKHASVTHTRNPCLDATHRPYSHIAHIERGALQV